jgi:hypothetical protein
VSVPLLGSAGHTHPEGNVGARGLDTCPACRASGRTLTDEQRDAVDAVLGALVTATGRHNHLNAGQFDAVTVALRSAILQGAELERARTRRRLDQEVQSYEAEVRRRMGAVRDDEPSAPELTHAHEAALAARALRRFLP